MRRTGSHVEWIARAIEDAILRDGFYAQSVGALVDALVASGRIVDEVHDRLRVLPELGVAERTKITADKCILWRSATLSLDLRVLRPGTATDPAPAAIESLARPRRVVLLAGNVEVERYPLADDGDRLDVARATRLALPRHEGITIRPSEESYQETARGDRPAVVLRVVGPLELRTVSHFDRTTGEVTGRAAADVVSSRVQCAMDVFVLLGQRLPEDIGIALASEHRDHFVRWKAIQTIAAFSAETGTELLLAALDDPHPDIRATAREALKECTT